MVSRIWHFIKSIILIKISHMLDHMFRLYTNTFSLFFCCLQNALSLSEAIAKFAPNVCSLLNFDGEAFLFIMPQSDSLHKKYCKKKKYVLDYEI